MKTPAIDRPGLRGSGRRPPAWASMLGLLLVAGCTLTRTEVASRQDVSFVPGSESLFVISHVARLNAQWAVVFEETLRAELKKTGIRARVQTRDPLALQSDQILYASQLSDFQPQRILVIVPREGTIDRFGDLVMQRFEAGLFEYSETESRRPLMWRAVFSLRPSGYALAGRDIKVLARDVVGQLAADGIVPEPELPPRPPALR